LKYEVILQPTAEADIESAYLYLRREASPEVANRWYNALLDSMDTLEEMPHRCPLAPESQFFPEEIRHLLIRPYRVLFAVINDTVRILHVRHMSRSSLMGTDE
jgi:plasmid stabilization system protein ParE